MKLIFLNFKKNHSKDCIKRAYCSYNNFLTTTRKTRKSTFASCVSHSFKAGTDYQMRSAAQPLRQPRT